MAQWLSVSTQFLTDPKIETLGDRHGPAGPLIIFALMARAKIAANAGRVTCSFRTLAHEAFTERADVRRVIESAADVRLITVEDMGEAEATVHFPAFLRWQDAGRKAKEREAENPSPKANVRRSPEASGPVPTDKQTDKQTKRDLSAGKRPTPGRQVFDAWVEATGKNPNAVKFSKERQSLISRRLMEWPLEDLLDAVKGWRHSPHHRGENERQTVYNDLDLLLRNAKNIERFRDLERESRRRRPASTPEGFVP